LRLFCEGEGLYSTFTNFSFIGKTENCFGWKGCSNRILEQAGPF
jgi:hypothetical protein